MAPVDALTEWLVAVQHEFPPSADRTALTALTAPTRGDRSPEQSYQLGRTLANSLAATPLRGVLEAHLARLAHHTLEDATAAAEHYQFAVEQLDARTQSGPLIEAYLALIALKYWSFEQEAVLRHAERGLELARRLEDRSRESEFLLWMGRAMDAREFHDEALRYYYQSLEISETVRDSSLIYQALDNIASTHYKRGAAEEGLSWLERAQPYVVLDKQRAGVALWRGMMLSALGRFAEAEASLFRARDLYDQNSDSHNPNAQMHVRFEIGKNYFNAGEYANAIAAAEDAFAVDPDRLGPFDYRYGYWLLSEAHHQLGDYEAAYTNLHQFFRWETHVDSISNLQNLQELTTRYETKEQQRIIDQQQTTIARRRWLGVALGFAVLFLGVAALGLFYLYRTRSHLVAQKRTIEEQTERLRELDRMKTNFFANISHELRTPLTLIQGPIQSALRSGQLDARHHRLLNRAQTSAKNLHELIESILALTKLEARRMHPVVRPVRLHQVIYRIALLFESYAQMRDIHYTFRSTVDEHLVVELDDRKLTVILNNLLSNALKYSNAGDTIRFSVSETPRDLHFEVRDTGRGIRPEDQQRVFDRYYQAETSTQGGAGIGLAMVREFSELMGGSVRLESTEHRGSTFTVSLPKTVVIGGQVLSGSGASSVPSPPELLPLAQSPGEEPTAAPDAPRILVVEDHPGLRDYLSTLLGPHYRTVEQPHGAAARSWLLAQPAAERPDLIISDVMMPELDGFGLLDWLKSAPEWQPLPVIMLTARADAADKLRALRTGVDDYLLKPFVEEELLARVANLIDNYRVRRAARHDAPSSNAGSSLSAPVAPAATEGTAVEATPEADAPTLFREDREWLERLETTVHDNLVHSDYSVARLALDMTTSERTLRRRIRQLVGLSPAKYLKAARLERARRLLERREYRTVAQVVAAVGLRDAGAFSRSYQEQYGKLPGEYL